MKRSFGRIVTALALAVGITAGTAVAADDAAPVASAQIPGIPQIPGLPDIPGVPALPEVPGLPQVPGSSELVAGSPLAALEGSVLPREFNVGGMKRQAYIETPVNAGNRPLPIIFMFGGRGNPAMMARAYGGFNLTDAGQNAIVVYPEGINFAWEGAPYAATKRCQDVAFVRHIVDVLSRERAVDRGRIFAAGLSNGGGMALALACQAPDLMNAVVGVSGAYYDPTVSNCAPGVVRTLLIHGDLDFTMNYNGGHANGGHYFGAEETLRKMSARNGCNVNAPLNRNQNLNVTEIQYAGCGSTKLQRVNGGVHTWYPVAPTAPINAWNFFMGR